MTAGLQQRHLVALLLCRRFILHSFVEKVKSSSAESSETRLCLLTELYKDGGMIRISRILKVKLRTFLLLPYFHFFAKLAEKLLTQWHLEFYGATCHIHF